MCYVSILIEYQSANRIIVAGAESGIWCFSHVVNANLYWRAISPKEAEHFAKKYLILQHIAYTRMQSPFGLLPNANLQSDHQVLKPTTKMGHDSDICSF